jgi:gentisate 1,2-dioxygenase
MESAEKYLSAGTTPASTNAFSKRARYYAPPNSFAFERPPVPVHRFVAERDRAFDPNAPTGFVALDLSRSLGVDFPCSSPLLLLRYARIRPGERLASRFNASAECCYVIHGRGHSAGARDRIAWAAGDVFCFPGGGETRHEADEDAILLVTTNEPQLAYEGARAPAPGDSPVATVHYPAEEIRHQLDHLCARGEKQTVTSKAVLLTSEKMLRGRTLTPTATFGVNLFEPGDNQKPHHHNAVALTLCIRARPGMYSRVAGQRVDWEEGVVMVTPPRAVHSHHNESDQPAVALVIQDGGMYYHLRTTGFDFA